MEQFVPHDKFNKRFFWGAIALAVVFVVLHMCFCIDVYDDIAKCYAPEARAFGRGDWANAFEDRIPPLMPTLAGILCYLGMHPFPALIFFSGLFYVLATFPLFAMLKYFLKRENLAVWGCLLYLLAPKIIRFSCTGLLNSGRNFFLLSAVWLVLSFVHKKSWWKLAGLGVVVAGLSLIRGEGILYIPLLFGWLFILLWRKNQYKLSAKLIINSLKYLLATFVLILLLISPRLYQVYRHTGYPVVDSRQVKSIKNIFKKGSTHKSWDTTTARKSRSELIVNKMLRLFSGFGRGAYLPYLALAILGLGLIISRKEFFFEYWMLLTIIAFNTTLFASIVMSYRYFTINLLFFMPFTVTGLIYIFDLTGKNISKPASGDNSMFSSLVDIINRYHLLRLMMIVSLIIIGLAQIKNGLEKLHPDKSAFEKGVGLWVANRYASMVHSEKRRMKIASAKPQYAMWGDADILWLNIRKHPEKNFTPALEQADFAIAKPKKLKVINLIRQSDMFIEIDHPYKNKVKVFQKKSVAQP